MVDATPIHAWLIGEGLQNRPIASLFEGLCERLSSTPFAIRRGHVSVNILHPALRGYGLTWRRDAAAISDQVFRHSDPVLDAWLTSPFKVILEQRLPQLRRRLTGPKALVDFPVLDEFRAEGLTDWIAFAHSFNPGVGATWREQIGMISSWATDASGGFDDGDVLRLSQIVGTFALAAKAQATNEIARNLLRAYVGPNAADRVLAGAITRGSVQRLTAAILFADLRNFTAFTEKLPVEAVVEILNATFDAIGQPITANGGEILKFIGDGLLAIFPVTDGQPAEACRRALHAAQGANETVGELATRRRQAGQPALDLDIALHVGEVLYGNVGTQERLDFTVVGSAVNATARIEQLCRQLERPLLVSSDLVRALGAAGPALRSLGQHRLAGVSDPLEVFAPE